MTTEDNIPVKLGPSNVALPGPRLAVPAAEWTKASGSCGLTVAADVYAAYVNGVALLAFRSSVSGPGQAHYVCVVVGHMTCGGTTLEQAQPAGVVAALDAHARDADRRLSRSDFDALVSDSTSQPSRRVRPRP